MDDKMDITAEDLLKNAHSWSLEDDDKLLKFMQKISENIESRVDKTKAALDKLSVNVGFTSVSIQNAANELAGLQHLQFVENRVYDDDETIANVDDVPNTFDEEEKITDPMETLKTVLKNSISVMEKCYEKVVIDIDDSDDEDGPLNSIVYRPKDPYQDRPLPYLIGSKEWKDKWHIGLGDSDEEYSGDQTGEDYSSDSAPSVSMSASIPSIAPTMSESECSVWGLHRNTAQTKRSQNFAVSSDEEVSTNTFVSKSSSDENRNLHSTAHSIVSKEIPSKSLNPVVENIDKYYIHKPKDKGLFDESSDESDSRKNSIIIPSKKENKISNVFNDEPPELIEPIKKDNEPINLFYQSDGEDAATPTNKNQPIQTIPTNKKKDDKISKDNQASSIVSEENSGNPNNTLRVKTVNLFGDDFDSFMKELEHKTKTKTFTKETKPNVQKLFDDDTDNEVSNKKDTLAKNANVNKGAIPKTKNRYIKKEDNLIPNIAKQPKLFDEESDEEFIKAIKSPIKVTEKVVKEPNIIVEKSTEGLSSSKKSANNVPVEKNSTLEEKPQVLPKGKNFNLKRNIFDDDLSEDEDLFKFSNNNKSNVSKVDELDGSSVQKKDKIPNISKTIISNLFDDDPPDDDFDTLFKPTNKLERQLKTNETSDTKIGIRKINLFDDIFTNEDESNENSSKVKSDKLFDDDNVKPKEKNIENPKKSTDFNLISEKLSNNLFLNDDWMSPPELDLPSNSDKKIITKNSNLKSDLFVEDIKIEHRKSDISGESKMSTATTDVVTKLNSNKLLKNIFTDEYMKDRSEINVSSKIVDQLKETDDVHKISLFEEDNVQKIVPNVIKDSVNIFNAQNDLFSNNSQDGSGKISPVIEQDKPKVLKSNRENLVFEDDLETILSPPVPSNKGNNNSSLEEVSNLSDRIVDKLTSTEAKKLQNTELRNATNAIPPQLDTPSNLIEPEESESSNKVTAALSDVRESKEESLETIPNSDDSVLPSTSVSNEIATEPKIMEQFVNNALKLDEPINSFLFAEPPDDDLFINKIEEKLLTSDSPNEEKTDPNPSALNFSNFGLFQDIPPDDDVFLPNPNENVKRLQHVFYDDIAETIVPNVATAKSPSTYIFSDEPPPDAFNFESKKLEKSDNKNMLSPNKDSPKSPLRSSSITGIANKIMEANNAEQKQTRELPSPKKINTNLVINVAALLPGAKRPNVEVSASSTKEDSPKVSKIEEMSNNRSEVTPTDTTAVNASRLTSLNKSRPKIQAKRNPSTRKGRQNNYLKSLTNDDEFGISSSYREDESINISKSFTEGTSVKSREEEASSIMDDRQSPFLVDSSKRLSFQSTENSPVHDRKNSPPGEKNTNSSEDGAELDGDDENDDDDWLVNATKRDSETSMANSFPPNNVPKIVVEIKSEALLQKTEQRPSFVVETDTNEDNWLTKATKSTVIKETDNVATQKMAYINTLEPSYIDSKQSTPSQKRAKTSFEDAFFANSDSGEDDWLSEAPPNVGNTKPDIAREYSKTNEEYEPEISISSSSKTYSTATSTQSKSTEVSSSLKTNKSLFEDISDDDDDLFGDKKSKETKNSTESIVKVIQNKPKLEKLTTLFGSDEEDDFDDAKLFTAPVKKQNVQVATTVQMKNSKSLFGNSDDDDDDDNLFGGSANKTKANKVGISSYKKIPTKTISSEKGVSDNPLADLLNE